MSWNEIASLRVLRKLRELVYLTWIAQVMRIDRVENETKNDNGLSFQKRFETKEMIWEQMGGLRNT